MIPSLLTSIVVAFTFLLSGGQSGVNVQGSAVIRDEANYVIVASPMEIHSVDGVTYVVDNQAKEVYIQESVGIDLSQVPDLLGSRKQLKGSYTDPASGQKFKYVLDGIVKITLEESEPLSDFNVDSLSEEWIVTDLR